jgi:catechol 1,2-dioxygenase
VEEGGETASNTVDLLSPLSLVDNITYNVAAKSGKPVTASAILGPFWRADTPTRPNGSTITFDTPEDGQVAFMHGKVTCAETGKPIANAVVDIWQASTNGANIYPFTLGSHTRLGCLQSWGLGTGLYEQQDDKQEEHNLRGKFVTDENGEYSLYCLRPTPYPVSLEIYDF